MKRPTKGLKRTANAARLGPKPLDGSKNIMTAWVARQFRLFEQLVGRRVDTFEGVEMAILEDDGTGAPRFDDRRVSFLQFNRLYLRFHDGMVAQVSNYQDDDEFGLSISMGPAHPDAGPYKGIYRFRLVPELPTGLMKAVKTKSSDRGNLSEVVMLIEDQEILLLAGEVEERHDSLVFHRDDESVLVFPRPADVSTIKWGQ